MRVVRDGWPVARVAEGSVVSRQTVHTWVRRYRAQGLPGLEDRSSRPKNSPRRLSPEQESRILAARRSRHGDQISSGRHCEYLARMGLLLQFPSAPHRARRLTDGRCQEGPWGLHLAVVAVDVGPDVAELPHDLVSHLEEWLNRPLDLRGSEPVRGPGDVDRTSHPIF